jgi:hypothetical protein
MSETTLKDRACDYTKRYGMAELCGTGTALLGYAVANVLSGGNPVIDAYAAAASENIGFYGVIVVRDVREQLRAAEVLEKEYSIAEVRSLIRGLALEFGTAEIIDTGVIRPLAMGVGEAVLGPVGVLAGKVVADVVFYGAAIVGREAHKVLDL